MNHDTGSFEHVARLREDASYIWDFFDAPSYAKLTSSVLQQFLWGPTDHTVEEAAHLSRRAVMGNAEVQNANRIEAAVKDE